MKKILLSIGLIGLFAFYAYEQRLQPQIQPVSYAAAQTQTSIAAPSPASSLGVGQLININGTIYLVQPSGLYGFPSMAVFNSYGYSLANVVSPNSAESSLTIVGIMPAQSQVATSPTQVPTPTAAGQYKDGSYTGQVADAVYGKIQVQAVIAGGKLTDVEFLQFPSGPGHTNQVSSSALPQLKSEAIAAQSANVDVVSGATQDSHAFQQSLGDALAQAKA